MAAEQQTSDTERLDFFAANSSLFVNLSKSWYVRTKVGNPFKKFGTLREAIDHVISKKKG